MLAGEQGSSHPKQVRTAVLVAAVLASPALVATAAAGEGDRGAEVRAADDDKRGGGDGERRSGEQNGGGGNGGGDGNGAKRGDDGDEKRGGHDDDERGETRHGDDRPPHEDDEGGRSHDDDDEGGAGGQGGSGTNGGGDQVPATVTPPSGAPATAPSGALNVTQVTRASEARATMDLADPATAPLLLPVPELADNAEADTRSASVPGRNSRASGSGSSEKEPSLPFTGFSLLALALSGLAAVTGGRRLQVATAADPALPDPPSPEPIFERALPVLAAAPDRRRRQVYVGVALVAVAALAASRR